MAGKTRGPARTPAERARAKGNPGHRAGLDKPAAATLPNLKTPPKPPRPLKTEGKKLWDRTWSLANTWLSQQTDLEPLMIACEALDERTELRKLVLADPSDRFARASLRALEKQLLDTLGLLGFTPTDRARLGVAEVKVEDDLEKFRREQGIA